jgi:peptide methionine sulfoxide reductase MsrB
LHRDVVHYDSGNDCGLPLSHVIHSLEDIHAKKSGSEVTSSYDALRDLQRSGNVSCQRDSTLGTVYGDKPTKQNQRKAMARSCVNEFLVVYVLKAFLNVDEHAC